MEMLGIPRSIFRAPTGTFSDNPGGAVCGSEYRPTYSRERNEANLSTWEPLKAEKGNAHWTWMFYYVMAVHGDSVDQDVAINEVVPVKLC